MNSLAAKLEENAEHSVQFLDIDEIDFEYKGVKQRTKNFLLKSFFNRNLKKEYKEKEMQNSINSSGFQDYILVVRPDKFSKKQLLFFKSNCSNLIAYLFDAVTCLPRQLSHLNLFDKVYSYEPEDVKKYDLQFITNFIPLDTKCETKVNLGLFNISSYDDRFETILKIAEILKVKDYPSKIIIKKQNSGESDLIDFVDDYLSLKETLEYIKNAAVLLDIQKQNQHGLSFRVFEALGMCKKLITTNKSIKDYDFYRKENILIIDKEKPVIPTWFLKGDYQEIPEIIKSKYRREAWLKNVFEV